MSLYEWIGIAVASSLIAVALYKLGFYKGLHEAKLLGVFCDVCEQVKPKLVTFKMTVMCEDCFHKIIHNRDMKCQFCQKQIEHCDCAE